MIPSFTAHPKSGKYPYPLLRTESDPFKEFARVFCANLTLVKLTQGKVTAESKLLAQWATLQYLSSEDFRRTFTEFKPVLSPSTIEVGITLQGISVSSVAISIPPDECFKYLTADMLRNQGILYEYFSLLESRMLVGDGHQFILTKQLYSDIPLDQVFTLERGVECGDLFWRMQPVVYNFSSPPQKWAKYMHWLREPELAQLGKMPLKDAYSYLAEVTPTQEALEAYRQLVERTFVELPMAANRVLHAKRVMELYDSYLVNTPRKMKPLCAYEVTQNGVTYWRILCSEPYRYGTSPAGYTLFTYEPLPKGWNKLVRNESRKVFLAHCYLPGDKTEHNWVQPITDVLNGVHGLHKDAHNDITAEIASL